MLHTIEIDGRERDIDVRPMDEGFIVYRKMYVAPLTPANIGCVNPGDWAEHLEEFKARGWQKLIEDFFRRQILALGSCAMLAWDGDGVIGKMYFTTREMWDTFRAQGAWYCVEHKSMPEFLLSLTEQEERDLLASPSRTLYAPCFNIGHSDRRYHGKGIASAMLEVLKTWAGEQGWRRLEMSSCADIIPFWALGGHVLRRGALERRGFHLARRVALDPETAATRRRIVLEAAEGQCPDYEWLDDYGRAHARTVAGMLADQSWEAECEVDYVMACDL